MVRLTHAQLAELEAIAKALSRPGMSVSRSAAIRVALLTGMEILMKEVEA